jgi:hypothetical protein
MILALAIHAAHWVISNLIDTGKRILKISQPLQMPGMYSHLKWSRGGG